MDPQKRVNAAFLMASYVVSFHLHLLFGESFPHDDKWEIRWVTELYGMAWGLQHCRIVGIYRMLAVNCRVVIKRWQHI
jgi:hypothetical protein